MDKIKLIIDNIEVIVDKNTTILDAARVARVEIPTLCHDESLEVYGACGICTVEVEGIPKLLRACASKATDGMIVHTKTDRVRRSRKVALELLLSDHDGDCIAPCQKNCPAGTDCQKYVGYIATGEYKKAVEVIKDKIPLPASIGRVCPHPCETACRRQLVEEPISIAWLKSFAADMDMASDNVFVPEVSPETGKSVAIIGGGPGGLTAAYFLRLKGHEITVFDAMPKMGGMLRYGIPQYRLPNEVLDKEIKLIEDLGIKLSNNIRIGKDITLNELKDKYDAVVVAIGAWKSSEMRVKGDDLDGVIGGIDFLRDVALHKQVKIGDKIAVVGGGNTAMDACRTAVRLGAKEVYVIYRRTRSEMPAEEIEIKEAEEEGVIFKFLTNPCEIIGKNGKVSKVRLQIMELGEPDESGRRRPVPIEGKFEEIEIDTVIIAIGQNVDTQGFGIIEKTSWGTILADEKSFRTSVDGVFAVGDATNKGADIAISAIGEAQKASNVINSYLEGNIIPYKKPYLVERNVTQDEFEDIQKLCRPKMPQTSLKERKNSFDEIIQGYTEDMAKKDAIRCLECGCHAYSDCLLIEYGNNYDVDPNRLAGEKHIRNEKQQQAHIEHNPDKCVLCGLCVRVCEEVVGKTMFGLNNRGFDSIVRSDFISELEREYCATCGKCVDLCPTGALKKI